MNGEIYFDMTEDDRPVYGESKFLIKRWVKHTIFFKSGSYNRTNNPKSNLYMTGSTYLYDYIAVPSTWYYTMIHGTETKTSVPTYDSSNGGLWTHFPNTFKDSPNAKVNNYTLSPPAPNTTNYRDPHITKDVPVYFELINGYPKTHFTHKRSIFSIYSEKITSGVYRRCSQTILTTIGTDGLNDGSSPIQSIEVGNVNLIQNENVINQ